jgi:steroid delta-isomerase-like uncharacterized protein
MSADENKAIVRRFLEGVINTGNPGVADEVCADDLAWHGGSLGEMRGLVAFKAMVGPFLAAFPGLRVEVGDLLADGDKVTARYTWRGAHRGEFFGIPPTGKEVTVTGISIYRVAGGKIAEEWWQEDLLGLMQQLGAIPAPGQGGA